jgi:anti-sigma B factor antagonist
METEPEFGVHVETPGAADEPAVLVLRGELDAVGASELARAVQQVPVDAPGLVFDMEDVSFIDSSGLRVLIQARQRFRDEPGAVRLRRPQASTTRLLDLTGLSEFFMVSS